MKRKYIHQNIIYTHTIQLFMTHMLVRNEHKERLRGKGIIHQEPMRE